MRDSILEHGFSLNLLYYSFRAYCPASLLSQELTVPSPASKDHQWSFLSLPLWTLFSWAWTATHFFLSQWSQIFSGFLLLLRHSLSGFLLGSLAPWRCDCVTSSQTSFGCFVSVCYVHFWAALSEFLLSLCAFSDWSPFSLTVCTFPLRWWSFFPQHLVIHGQTPTSLHNCPWFLLPFFLLSGLVTWRNLRCFHVLLLLILHFFDPVISLKCPLDFVLSFPYMASWATSLLL